VFFSRGELPPEARDVEENALDGRIVTFAVAPGKDGRSKAEDVQLSAAEGDIATGKIKSFSEWKGYGFIASSSLDGDIHFKASDCPDLAVSTVGWDRGALVKGELVTFHARTTPNGRMMAGNVKFQSPSVVEKLRANSLATECHLEGKVHKRIERPIPVPRHLAKRRRRSRGGSSVEEQEAYQNVSPPVPLCEQIEDKHILGEALDLLDDDVNGEDDISMLDCLRPAPSKTRSLRAMSASDAAEEMPSGYKDGAPMASLGERVGVVKSYQPRRRFGFITCEDVGGDVFFTLGMLPAYLQHDETIVGQPVRFGLASTTDGKLRAEAIRLVADEPSCSEAPDADCQEEDEDTLDGAVIVPSQGRKCQAESGGGGSVEVQECHQDPTWHDAPSTEPLGEQTEGIIKSYHPGKGFGFITCEDIEGDIFFKKSALPAHAQGNERLAGQVVSCGIVTTLAGKLRAQAISLCADDPAQGQAPGDEGQDNDREFSCSSTAAARPRKRRAAKSTGWVSSQQPESYEDVIPTASPDEHSHGVIRSYNPAKGFGFITCEEVTGDVFFSKAFLPVSAQESETLAGQAVTFGIAVTPNGKRRAEAIRLCADDPLLGQVQPDDWQGASYDTVNSADTFDDASNAVFLGEAAEGVIKSYHPGKSFGFITCKEVDVDIFFSKFKLPAGVQDDEKLAGQVVRFGLVTCADGKLRAEAIRLCADEVPSGDQFSRSLQGAGKVAALSRGRKRRARHAACEFEKQSARHGDRSTASPDEQADGVIKSYNAARSFGFIACDGIDGDVFFRRSSLPEHAREDRTLPGKPVKFELASTTDGKMRAEAIRLCGEGPT